MRISLALRIVLMLVSVTLAAKDRPELMPASSFKSGLLPGRAGNATSEFEQIRLQQQERLAAGDRTGAKLLENEIQAVLLSRQSRRSDIKQPVILAARPQWFAPDQQIDGAPPYWFAVDYEQDPNGTMWVAVGSRSDSSVHVLRSTNHGASWDWLTGYYWPPKHPIGKLELVVGEGDSNFVYVFELLEENNGDLRVVRLNHNGSVQFGTPVLVGPDSITDFAACRDYVRPYYLYGVAYNGMQERTTDWPAAALLRSTDFGLTWAITDSIANCSHPRLRAGAGSHIYLGAAPRVARFRNVAQASLSTFFGSPGSWLSDDVVADSFRVYDAVFAPAFTLPESTARCWIVFSHNYNGTLDWDVLYAHTNDRMRTWSVIDDIAYSTAVEAYVDLKPFTERGNPYVNASYVRTDDFTCYLVWAQANQPDNWSAPTLINQTVRTGFGYDVTPQIVYSPHGPGPGGGLVFADADSTGVYFNAPWFTGGAVSESRLPRAGGAALVICPTVGRGSVTIGWSGCARQVLVTDVAGRVVADFDRPDGSSVVWDAKVPAGTYFVRVVTDREARTGSMVIR